MRAIKLWGFADSSRGCLFLFAERKRSSSKVKMKIKSTRFAPNIPHSPQPLKHHKSVWGTAHLTWHNSCQAFWGFYDAFLAYSGLWDVCIEMSVARVEMSGLSTPDLCWDLQAQEKGGKQRCCQNSAFRLRFFKTVTFFKIFGEITGSLLRVFFKVWFVLLAHGSLKNKNPLHEKNNFHNYYFIWANTVLWLCICNGRWLFLTLVRELELISPLSQFL